MKGKPHICFKSYYFVVIALSLILLIVVNIALQTAIARYQQPIPQAILTLGGGLNREQFTADFARFYPSIPIWVSSGVVEVKARQVYIDAGISLERLHLDRRATDTVTNFTTLVADFKSHNIKHLFLITSDFHIPRAKAIAYIVLGSQGIAFTPLTITTENPPEAKLKIWRDTGRALLWLFTKHTGSTLRDWQSQRTERDKPEGHPFRNR